MPGLGMGIAAAGMFLLFFLAPFLLKDRGGKFYVPFKEVLFLLILQHVVGAVFYPNSHSLHYTLKFSVQVAFFILFVNLIKSLDQLDKLTSRFIIFSGIILCYFTYIYMFVYHSPFLSTFLGGSASRVGKNTLSTFLSLILPFVLAYFLHKRSWLSLLLLALFTFDNLYVLSRMSLICTVGAYCLFLIYSIWTRTNLKPILFLYGILIFIALYFNIGFNTFLEFRKVDASEFIPQEGHRISMLKEGIEGFLNRPILGNGIGSFHTRNYYVENAGSHNEYIHVLYELGMVGLILFAILVLGILWQHMKIRKYVPSKYMWLWDSHFIAILVLGIALIGLNLYLTSIMWFILTSAVSFQKLIKDQATEISL